MGSIAHLKKIPSVDGMGGLLKLNITKTRCDLAKFSQRKRVMVSPPREKHRAATLQKFGGELPQSNETVREMKLGG
jgi:hypothetical protein